MNGSFKIRKSELLIGFLILFLSCSKAEKDSSFTKSDISFFETCKTNSFIDHFFKTYNSYLKQKVNEKFLPEFYFHNEKIFDNKIIFSNSGEILIYIEGVDTKENKSTLYYSDKNPQIFIQQLKNNRIEIDQPPSYNAQWWWSIVYNRT